LQERTCAQLPWLSIASFLVLEQAPATVAEKVLKESIAGNLRRHP
jgi:hypothetical protein